MKHLSSFVRPFVFLLVSALLVPSSIFAQSGFRVAIRPPVRNVQKYAPYQQFLEQSRMLHLLAETVNENFVIPGNVWMTAEECGEVNAFWHSDRRLITMCYEILDEIFGEFRYDGLTQDQFGTAVASTTLFIAMHEVGHALVDMLNLPVTGREEDVVDQFAAIALGDEDPNPAWWAAEYWRTRGDFGDTGLLKQNTPFEDEHSFDMQRFYNVLCLTYGRDPNNRGMLLGVLPQTRAVRCPSEYQRIASSWETILAPHAREAGPAAIPAPTGQAAFFGGEWQMTEQIGSSADGMYCESQIGMQIEQTGNVFAAPYNQTGTCIIAGQRYDNPGAGQLQGGRIDGGQIYFRMETCTYVGQIQKGTGGLLAGTVSCEVEQNGGVVTVNGTWRATRR